MYWYVVLQTVVDEIAAPDVKHNDDDEFSSLNRYFIYQMGSTLFGFLVGFLKFNTDLMVLCFFCLF